MNRRQLIGAGAAGALTAASAQVKPATANDRIGIGIIGCGGMGRIDLADFQSNPDVQIRAVCDVFAPNAARAAEMTGGKAQVFRDFRKVLEQKSVDAVVIATPDHWHAIMTTMACDAGKDVYVEKPISHNVREGRLMVEAARRTNRVVDVGIQQRSGSHFQRAVKAVQEGRIGKVHTAECWNHGFSPDPKGMGNPPATTPPADLDWDMFLGPAPKVDYTPARRNFRAFWDYAGGELTNWCVHLIDIVHWATGADKPLTVTSSGGKYYYTDCRDCADTQEVIWEYPGNLLVRYSTTVHNSFGPNGHPGNKSFGSYGTMLHGTKGTLFIDRAGYEIIPQMTMHREPGGLGSQQGYDDLVGTGLYFTSDTGGERSTTSPQHLPHVRNFLDCIKSRQRPAGDIEIGHLSTATCLIGNIALRTGMKLKWDAAAERFTNSEDANSLLTRDYLAPWKLNGLKFG